MSILIWLGVLCIVGIFLLSDYGKKMEILGEGGWLFAIFDFIFSRVRRIFVWLHMTRAGSFVWMSIFSSIAASYLFFNTLNPLSAASDMIRGARYKHYDNLKKQGGHEEKVAEFESNEHKKIIKLHEKQLKNDNERRILYEKICISRYNSGIRDKKTALRKREDAMRELERQCVRPYTKICREYENMLEESEDKLRYIKKKEKRYAYDWCKFFIMQPGNIVQRKYEEFHEGMEKY